ncbi:hypothetical protein PFISCL1PPCAC_23009, partial [Pristionchus fissidentatus]
RSTTVANGPKCDPADANVTKSIACLKSIQNDRTVVAERFKCAVTTKSGENTTRAVNYADFEGKRYSVCYVKHNGRGVEEIETKYFPKLRDHP